MEENNIKRRIELQKSIRKLNEEKKILEQNRDKAMIYKIEQEIKNKKKQIELIDSKLNITKTRKIDVKKKEDSKVSDIAIVLNQDVAVFEKNGETNSIKLSEVLEHKDEILERHQDIDKSLLKKLDPVVLEILKDDKSNLKTYITRMENGVPLNFKLNYDMTNKKESDMTRKDIRELMKYAKYANVAFGYEDNKAFNAKFDNKNIFIKAAKGIAKFFRDKKTKYLDKFKSKLLSGPVKEYDDNEIDTEEFDTKSYREKYEDIKNRKENTNNNQEKVEKNNDLKVKFDIKTGKYKITNSLNNYDRELSVEETSQMLNKKNLEALRQVIYKKYKNNPAFEGGFLEKAINKMDPIVFGLLEDYDIDTNNSKAEEYLKTIIKQLEQESLTAGEYEFPKKNMSFDLIYDLNERDVGGREKSPLTMKEKRKVRKMAKTQGEKGLNIATFIKNEIKLSKKKVYGVLAAAGLTIGSITGVSALLHGNNNEKADPVPMPNQTDFVPVKPEQETENPEQTTDNKTLFIDDKNNKIVAPAGTVYEYSSDGVGTTGTFKEDTEVSVYNRAIIHTDENGKRTIVHDAKCQTWEEYAKQNGINYAELQEQMSDPSNSEYIATQIANAPQEIKNTYGWVKADTLMQQVKEKTEHQKFAAQINFDTSNKNLNSKLSQEDLDQLLDEVKTNPVIDNSQGR